MRIAIVLIATGLLLSAADAVRKAKHATWNGQHFTCPANTDIWADESEALAGKDCAYCVRGTK